MDTAYEKMLALARKLKYNDFTKLQRTAFLDPNVYDKEKNIMVIGPTSSGKTLIPVLMYAAEVQQAMEAGEPIPKMLFIVPYRALAAQKCRELKECMRSLLGDDLVDIAQSTGELRQYDDDICYGYVSIGVVINEKAFLFGRKNPAFLSQYRYVVMDEIGLVADQARGIKLDFLLSWIAASSPRPRVVALATPFYKWDSYAEHFHFHMIASQERPRLLKCPVFFSGRNANGRHIDVYDWPAQCTGFQSYSIYRKGKGSLSPCAVCGEPCPVELPCRQDRARVCSHTQEPCCHHVEMLEAGIPFRYKLIADLCRWHLEQKHRILIFWNDRENCRQLALYLFHALGDRLRKPPALEECKEIVLSACTRIANEESDLKRTTMISEDEMFGILEQEHYLALCAGVGFHSSAVPLELRSYVENSFLESDRLSIVCATETLAFGINSAVDAVIVADMNKNLDGGKQFLEANTYFNYIGRCGRLRPDKPMEDIVGWVHPILAGYSPQNKNFDPCDLDSEYMRWQDLERKRNSPDEINSTIFQDRGQNLPFLLLCLLGEDTKKKGELQAWLEALPAPEGAELHSIDEALRYLLRHGLICPARLDEWEEINADRMDLADPEAEYRVVEGREGLCGFTPSAKDFDIIIAALGAALEQPDEAFEPVLLYGLLEAGYMENSMRNFRMVQSDGHSAAEKANEDEQADRPEERQAVRRGRDFSAENLPSQLQKLPVWEKMRPLLEMEQHRLFRLDIRRRLVVTAAVLCWAESADPRRLNEWFSISYPLIQGLTRELSYLLEIAKECLYTVERREGEPLWKLEERKVKIAEKIQTLERAVYFGLQPELYQRLLGFFAKRRNSDAAADRLWQTIRALQPGTARQLRRLFSAYMTLIDALECQKKGRGPRNYATAATALKETMNWRGSAGDTLWREFAITLKNEGKENV